MSAFKRFSVAVAVTALIISVVQSGEIPEELKEAGKQAHDICVKKTGAQEEHIANAMKGEFAEDEKFKCYLNCILEQFNLLKEDDTINYEVMEQLAPESMKSNLEQMKKECGQSAGANKCEKAFNLNKCAYKVNPNTYFSL
ncbi:general odorant-binding protein 83a [Orussus abietinus]|uniref:general odorant-binding protein 83a n=1 Tax=Orussus abietinus TaxID=222816 RepID=UPI000626D40A|nr:general odorant-binding protein 83a [Orussus abietinus]